jgi:glycosyltransferase involved in cell wall biosynthesis
VARNGLRMLFISPLLAMPQQHGGCVYPDAVLRAMHGAGMAIDYIWLAWPLMGNRKVMRDPLRAPYIRCGFVPGTYRFGNWRVRDPRVWRRADRGEFPGVMSIEPLPGLNEQSFLRRVMGRIKPRTVLVDFATTLPILDGLSVSDRAQLRVAVLTHNLSYRRTELYRDRKLPLDFRALARDEEAALLRRADVIVAIQEREAAEFRRLVPDRSVIVVPMPVESVPSRPGTSTGDRCLFVGGYSGHNLDGLDWFLREVWPVVLSCNPDARFDVVGTVGDAVPAGVPNVYVYGQQRDLSTAYNRASICVVPLRFGTGLKIKLIEAMVHGRAVVATSVGAEGYSELEMGTVVTVADTASGMAGAITRLLRDKAARDEQIARQDAWVQHHLAGTRAVAPLLSFFAGGFPT